MTIRKGEAWGAPGALPDDGIVVRSDAEAADAGPRTIGLLGGDLCRTLGGTGDEARLRSPEAMTFPVDLGVAELDGERHVFIAHLVARHALWLGRVVVVMNAAWLGEWNLGPKAHPNDGLLDTSDARLRPSELLAARSRAPRGNHVPHPRITTARVASAEFEFDRPVPVRLDGRLVGRYRSVRTSVEPDARRVVV